MYILWLLILFWCFILLFLIIMAKKPVLYKNANGWETNTLENWRKRGADMAKDKETKSLIKNANTTQLLGILFIVYGWDLVKCK